MIRHRRPDPVSFARLRCAVVLLAAALALLAGVALAAPAGVASSAPSGAAPAGVALVIGEGSYADRSALPGCSQAAAAVVGRLRRLGFTIDQAIDAPAGVVRGALESFASHVQAAPAGPVLAYVCAESAVVGPRLFLLPSEIDLHQTLRPETQGIVVRTLLRILAGTKGSLVMELAVPTGTVAAPAARTLEGELPDGLHLAMTIGDGKQAGAFGRLLAGDAAVPTQDWAVLVAALRNSVAGVAPSITVYAPEPAAATVASSEPGADTPPASEPEAATPPASVAMPPAAGGPAAHAGPLSSDAATSPEGAGPPPPAVAPQVAGTPESATPAPATPVPATPVPATPAPTTFATPAPAAPMPATSTPTAPPPAPTTSATSRSAAPAPSRVAPRAASRADAPSSAHDRSADAASTRPAPAAEADNRAASSARITSGNARSSQAAMPEREAPPLEARGDDRIWRLQAALTRRGFYRGPLDGRASLVTLQAIRGYQASLRDPATGVLTQIEIVRLLNNW